MRVAMEAQNPPEPGQQRHHLRAVHRPLRPGPKDRVQGSVGQDNQGRLGVQAVKLPGQPTAAGLTYPEGRSSSQTPGGVQAQDLTNGFLFAVCGFR